MTLEPMIKPTTTPPYTLLLLTITFLSSSVLRVFNLSLHLSPIVERDDWNTIKVLLLESVGALAIIGIIVSFPFNTPTAQQEVKKDSKMFLTSPEEQVSLAGFLSFQWTKSLEELANIRTLDHKDLWALKPSLKTEVASKSAEDTKWVLDISTSTTPKTNANNKNQSQWREYCQASIPQQLI